MSMVLSIFLKSVFTIDFNISMSNADFGLSLRLQNYPGSATWMSLSAPLLLLGSSPFFCCVVSKILIVCSILVQTLWLRNRRTKFLRVWFFRRMITYNIRCCMSSATSTASRTSTCRRRRSPVSWRSWRSTYGRKYARSWRSRRVQSGCAVCPRTRRRCRTSPRWWRSQTCGWTRCRPTCRSWSRRSSWRTARAPSSPARRTVTRTAIWTVSDVQYYC